MPATAILAAIAPPPRVRLLRDASAATRAYIAAVEAADGQRLENAALSAIIPLANWRIPLGGAAVLPAAARTLAGALVPMVGPAPAGVNLVDGDYNRGRLQLNGINKSITSNYNNNAPPQDSRHCYVNLTAGFPFDSSFRCLFGGTFSNGHSILFSWPTPSTQISICASGGTQTISARTSFPVGGIGVFRNSSTAHVLRWNGASEVYSNTSVVPVSSMMQFGADMSSASNAPMAFNFYSVGPYIDPAELDTRTATFTAAINAAGIQS